MKLQLKVVQSNTPGGRTAFLLCDESGAPLPNQKRVNYEDDADYNREVTVTFTVGGNIELVA